MKIKLKDLSQDEVVKLLHQKTVTLEGDQIVVAGNRVQLPHNLRANFLASCFVECKETTKVFVMQDGGPRVKEIHLAHIKEDEYRPSPVGHRTAEIKIRDLYHALDHEFRTNKDFADMIVSGEKISDLTWLRNKTKLWADYQPNPYWEQASVNADPLHPDNLSAYVLQSWRVRRSYLKES